MALLSTANIDNTKLRSILTRIKWEELIKLSEACYVPGYRTYYAQLLEACGLNEQAIEDFTHLTWSGRREEKWRKFNDHITLFFIWLMWYCLNQGDQATFNSALVCHMIRQYGNLFRKYLKFCKPDVFNDTLDRLTKTHLFYREKTIPQAISYLSNELGKKFAGGIRVWDLDKISAFITESRHRLDQSMNSFKKSYLKNEERLKAYKSSYEAEGREEAGVFDEAEGREETSGFVLDETDSLASDVSRLICVKGQIDQKALNTAKKLTDIRMSTATRLVKELSSSINSGQYSNDVGDILHLFLKNLPSVKLLSDYRLYIRHFRGLMRVKRTNKPVYFKKQVHELLRKLVKNTGYKNTFETLSKQTQSLHSEFLAFYITMVLRNHL